MPDEATSDAVVTPMSPRRRLGLVLAVAAAVVVLDQLTKWWAVSTLSHQTIDVVWKLRLILVENRGTAFSLTQSGGPVDHPARPRRRRRPALVQPGRPVPAGRWSRSG